MIAGFDHSITYSIWWGGLGLTYNSELHILHSSKREFLSTSYFESMRLILSLPDDCTVYPVHDYVLEYIEFVRDIDPENKYLDEAVNLYNPAA